jgi:hypothetical protein
MSCDCWLKSEARHDGEPQIFADARRIALITAARGDANSIDHLVTSLLSTG